jgi:serine O-acetyltransferase
MTLLQQIKEDFSVPYRRDPAMHSRLEIIFNYPGVWAVVWHRIANKLYTNNFKRLGRLVSAIGALTCSVDIHPAATIGRRLFIDHGIGVVIGETAEIGEDVTIYQQVTLGGVELTDEKRHPTIKNGAVLGAGSKVLGNITVGENAKIGANSVVIKDVPDDTTAVGVPARNITKGTIKSPLSHNKLPDIDRELFTYLVKRISILEEAIVSGDTDFIQKDKELEDIYQAFIKSMEK